MNKKQKIISIKQYDFILVYKLKKLNNKPNLLINNYIALEINSGLMFWISNLIEIDKDIINSINNEWFIERCLNSKESWDDINDIFGSEYIHIKI